jgi:hypothetical protein
MRLLSTPQLTLTQELYREKASGNDDGLSDAVWADHGHVVWL